MPLLTVNLVRVGSLTVGIGTVEPGWRWSTHMRKATDQPLCRIHHLQVLSSGRFAVQMDDGEYAEIGLPTSKDRIVTTLLMTDIVDSTATASGLGGVTWKQRLGEHDRVVRTRLERYLGREVNTTGDGFLAMFASVRGAILCAASIRDGTAGMGLPVRIGVHTGEVELLPGDIGGVAVHAAARVIALGGASDIMVSSSARGHVEDGDLRFESKGVHRLKGLPTPLEVFALVDRAIVHSRQAARPP